MSVSAHAGTYRLRVEAIVEQTPDVRMFRLSLPSGVSLDFRPGQWMMVSFPDTPQYQRAYSLASSPLDKGHIDIALNRVARFTERMFALKGGETLTAKGPYGKWCYTDDVKHAVLISGGTGITPFRSILRYVEQKKLPNRVTVLYSSRTPTDGLFREELETWSRLPQFKIVHTITRPQLLKSPSDWTGPTGRIGIDLIKQSVDGFDKAVFFLCGPNQLVEDLSKALAGQGVGRDRIRREKWGEF